MIIFYDQFYLRKAIRLALSASPGNPANDILLPGMCLPGFAKYRNKCFSVQVMPDPFMALL